MIRRLVFLGGLACAFILAGWMPASASGSCQAWTAYGDCYIELTGCSGGCSFDPGENGQGSLTGNCTGYGGACVGNWFLEASWCDGSGGMFTCEVRASLPLVY